MIAAIGFALLVFVSFVSLCTVQIHFNKTLFAADHKKKKSATAVSHLTHIHFISYFSSVLFVFSHH